MHAHLFVAMTSERVSKGEGMYKIQNNFII